MKHKATIIYLSLYFLSCISANAQMARIYSSESGLANSQINGIYQGRNGFIWIATGNGLSRFDGMDFETFRFDRANPHSIASDLVLNVFEDSRGTSWIGTSAGLQTFDEEYNSFTKTDLRDKSVPSSDQHIAEIAEIRYMGKEMIAAASSGHGIYLLDILTHEPCSEGMEKINNLLPSQFIREIFIDSRNWMWVGAEDGGICVIDLETCTVPSEIRNISDKDIRSGIVVTSFEEDTRTGDIILGSSSHGILIYDKSSGVIRMARDKRAGACMVESILRNNLAPQYGDGTFLIGLENNGIKLFDTETESLTDISFPNVPYRTSGWKVHDLMEDNQGNVWVGAYQTGVMVIPKSMYGFESIGLGSKDGYGAEGVCVTSVIQDPESGDLWVGTDGSGIFRIEDDGKRTHFTSMNSGLTNNSIMSLVIDKRGRLWIATYLGGIFSWTPRTGFREFRDQKAVNTNKTVCLAYSEKEDILYVGTHGSGMSIISLKDEKVTRTYSDDDNKWISTLYIDKAGMLWVGTYDGPMCYDHRVKKLIQYELSDSLKTRVHTFCEASDGKVWIGTGEGLYSYERANGKIVEYTEEDGLPSNVINEVREGNDGSLWIATLNGLSRFNPHVMKFKNYYQFDGLQENEFHTGASFISSDGRMYFGGIKGLTSFYPHIVDQRTHPVPPLYFSDLRVMNEPVAFGQSSENILDKHITQASRITLPNDRNMFSLKFSVLEYTNPRKITYDYMMEGFDDSWNHTGPDSRTVTYTNLPAGRYRLMVKAYFEGEPEEYAYKEIGIKVLPPWYMTIWAFMVYAVLAVMACIGFIRRRKAVAAQKKEKEESEIKELKLRMFTNISHEIRTPLTLVMSPLKQMREAENDPMRKELYNLMYRNSLRILRLVNQLMDMRKIDNGQLQLHFLKTDVVYFIKDIMKSFDNLAVSRNINLSIDSVLDANELWIDQGNFDKIIFNILSNAFKYTPENGTISIHISGVIANDGVLKVSAGEYVEFTIRNSGSSIDERYLDKVFDRFFQVDVKDAKVGSGVGLNLAKMLVELHHGDIRAYNTKEGMAFSVRIPCGSEHLSATELTKPTNHKDLYTKSLSQDAEFSESKEDVSAGMAVAEEPDTKLAKSKKSIVLVDDDTEMRAYLKLELQSLYNVETCSNAKDAWAHISTTVPDAVVTDLMMDGMDGAELCGKIKKNPGTNHIPVIILTSSTEEMNQQRCTDSGADRFFTKPISLNILKSAIANAISTRDTIKNKYNKDIDYGYSEIKMTDSSNQLVSKVIKTIRENIENSDFSVEELSREVGMSRVHLNRKLKETMNISPGTLIKSIRLKQAAFLLLNNNVNISEVAYKVGFSSHSYFSNSFHDFFGMTPKEFVAKYMDCKDEDILKRIFE